MPYGWPNKDQPTMAVTIALVFAGKNRLRYLMTTESSAVDTGTITTSGAATPDTATDTAGGPLEEISKVVAQGYGPLAAGAQTQARARQLWLSNRPGVGFGSSADFGPTGGPVTAICKIERRTGNHTWRVDANVSVGSPIIEVASIGEDGVIDGTAYLDIFIPGAIGA